MAKMDYSVYTKEELIAMLEARDATDDDLQVMDIKIERLSSEKTALMRRKQEVSGMGILSEEEKQDLIAGIQARADKTDAELTSIKDLRNKL